MGHQLAIPTEDADAVVAVHNVAGAGGVLNAAGGDLENYVNAHYAPRGIDHIPYTGRAEVNSYVLTDDPASLHNQARYREQLAGIRFTPIADLGELVRHGVQRAVYLPYIRLQDDDFPSEIEWLRYGLPPEITTRLKDKAYMHRWLVRRGFAHYTPNFVTCHALHVAEYGVMMLEKIAQMLDDLGMIGRYPLGLMIRSALSDGNYSMASLLRAEQNTTLNGQAVRAGQYILKPDGKTENAEIHDDAESALARVREHLMGQNDPHIDNRAVMTRLLDVDVSPGLCTAITGGDIYDFPFNGQYMAPGHTACTGTWTFASAVGDAQAAAFSERYLRQSQWLLRSIVTAFFKPQTLHDLYAMLNIDVMILGKRERELWERAGASERLRRYRAAVGHCEDDYQPRVYDPRSVIFAEVNPRDTNWTIAMKAVLQAQNQPCTVENLMGLAGGEQAQVLARDHWPLPPDMDAERGRDLLLAFHQRLAQNGEGFIVRMADNPAGVILYTPSGDPSRLSEIAGEAFDYLKKAGKAL